MDDRQRQDLEDLLQIHARRLHELERQAATFGISTPPHIRSEIDDIRAEIDSIALRLGTAPGILPPPVPDFTGRDAESADLIHVLSQAVEQNRVVISCIRGMGGLGKSQLALAVAQQLMLTFPDGQVLIALRGTRTNPTQSTYALQSIIRAFNRELPLPDDLTQLQTIYHSTFNGKYVLILADDASDAAQVRPLTPPPGCALLITSRQRFTLPGMRTLELDALSMDATVALLLAICPRIGGHARTLAALCGYLPLALRVSASLLESTDTRSVARYLVQLEAARLRYLRDPENPDDPEASVEASLRLSYDALDPSAQQTLTHLAVFPSSFDLAAAEAIITDVEDVETTLEILRRRSLVQWNMVAERYALHDLVRAFAAARLPNATREAARQRHAHYYMALAEAAEGRLHGPDERVWLDRLDAEHDHLRAALAWSLQAHGADDLEVRLAGALWWFWDIRGYVSEGRAWLEQALASSRELSPLMRARALLGAGWLARTAGDYTVAMRLGEESLALLRSLNDQANMGWALVLLGRIAIAQGDLERAAVLYREVLTNFQNVGDTRGSARALNLLGCIANAQGDLERATDFQQESLRLFQSVGDQWGVTRALNGMGKVWRDRGDDAQAAEIFAQGLAISRTLGFKRGIATALHNLAHVTLHQGDVQRAAALFAESLTLHREVGDTDGLVDCLAGMAELAAAQRQPVRAARLFGALESLLATLRASLAPDERAHADSTIVAARAQLNETAFVAAWAEGQAMSLEQVIAEALRVRD